ncbi:AI-2E family transporter [bacterium]|nr:AI-2E family transporter [bacterium]
MFGKDFITKKNIIFVLLVIIVLFFVSAIKDIALLFFAAYVIACSLNPLVDLVSKKMNRCIASSLVLFATITVIFAFFIPVIFVAVKQVEAVADFLPQRFMACQDFFLNYQFYGHKLPDFINFNSIMGSSTHMASGLVNQSINITIGFAQNIIFFLAVCMIVFYLLVDKEAIRNYFISIFPQKMREKTKMISETMAHKVGGYVVAQILSMVAVGGITAIFLAILKVDYSLLLGLITGVLDIIPIVGPTIALLLCLFFAYSYGWVGLLLTLIAFLAAQWLANNLVKPVVFGKFLNLHPLVIIFALLVCAQFLGVWGVILAPAIAAIVYVLFDELYLKEINKVK